MHFQPLGWDQGFRPEPCPVGSHLHCMLADMGAEVIKVESFAGDQFREPMDGANFYNFNRKQKGNRPQLKSQRGKRDRLETGQGGRCPRGELFARSMDRLGLGYESVSRINRESFTGSISGSAERSVLGPSRL